MEIDIGDAQRLRCSINISIVINIRHSPILNASSENINALMSSNARSPGGLGHGWTPVILIRFYVSFLKHQS